MLCHAGRVASTTALDAANGSVDLESFFDDLKRMQELVAGLGIPAAPVPFDLDGLTLAVGAQDAFGLGFRFAGSLAGGVNTSFGPQRAPAWWTLKHKTRIYSDGAGDASSHHSMMATLVAFGVTPDQLVAREQDFLDLAHYIRSIEPPCWALSALSADKRARGRRIFESTCARCHGVYEGPEAHYPNLIVPLEEIGTDPVRAQRFGQPEAARLNSSWFGDPPFQPTFGYLLRHSSASGHARRTSTMARFRPCSACSILGRARRAGVEWIRSRGLRRRPRRRALRRAERDRRPGHASRPPRVRYDA